MRKAIKTEKVNVLCFGGCKVCVRLSKTPTKGKTGTNQIFKSWVKRKRNDIIS